MERKGRMFGAAWTAVLSVSISVLPSLAARSGGRGGWLGPVLALPVFLLLIRAWRSMGRDEMALPRPLTFIYIMWALLLGAARLRLSVRRLQFTGQGESGAWFVLLVLAAGAAWLAWGKEEAFLRAAAVFGRALSVVLLGVLGLTLAQVRIEEVAPLDVLPALNGALSALGVLCVGVYGAFVWDGTPTKVVGRAALGCGLLSLMLLSVLGNLGVELAAALEDPFLSLCRHVGVAGAFQRVESLISALWLLGDLALAGLLLWACRRLLGRWGGHRMVLCAAAVILLLDGTIFRTAVWAQRFEHNIMPWGNLVLGGVIPCVLPFRNKKRSISCGEKA